MTVLLMSISTFKERSFVDTNVDDKVVKLSMELAQDHIIAPITGTKLYDKISEGVNEGSLAISYQNLLVKYIWPLLIQGTEIIAKKHLLYRVTNDSIVKSSNSNSTAIDISELRSLLRDNEQYLNGYEDRLKLYLSANSASFPEYYQADSDDIPSENYNGPINFYYDGPEIYTTGPSSR